jgi:Zn-dependent protease
MDIDIANLIRSIAVYAIPVLFAITVHEAAHGYVARRFGDMTAAAQGRLSLNPFRHIDPVGTVLLPLFLLVATKGQFVFGYAKPVPVNMAYLRNPKRDMIWVALAGPMSNFVQAIIWAFLYIALDAISFHTPGLGAAGNFFESMAFAGIAVNLVLCMLNLFPIPPLDGGRIVTGLLPYNLARTFAQIEPFGFLIVIALLFTGFISNYWIWPLFQFGMKVVWWIHSPLIWLLS